MGFPKFYTFEYSSKKISISGISFLFCSVMLKPYWESKYIVVKEYNGLSFSRSYVSLSIKNNLIGDEFNCLTIYFISDLIESGMEIILSVGGRFCFVKLL